jgi:hypothetical protein
VLRRTLFSLGHHPQIAAFGHARLHHGVERLFALLFGDRKRVDMRNDRRRRSGCGLRRLAFALNVCG